MRRLPPRGPRDEHFGVVHPQVDFPTIQVAADLPGASAETMALSVAAPLEKALGLISGVTSLSSTSALGRTRITVEFDLGRNVDGAAQDVQMAISSAAGLLPRNLPNPPTYEKVNPADALLMSIAVTSDDLPRPISRPRSLVSLGSGWSISTVSRRSPSVFR